MRVTHSAAAAAARRHHPQREFFSGVEFAESLLIITSYSVIVLMAISVLLGVWFVYHASSEARRDRGYAPYATVFLPCKGVDDGLRATLHSILRQEYPDYELICAVEAENDPAIPLIEEMFAALPRMPARVVVAEQAAGCSQKIVNLIAAIRTANPQSEVFAFLDSDSIPKSDWLRSMVAPLADVRIGATTGFRWYTARGSFTSWLRCAWNAMALTFLGRHRQNFCWGGSTAVRRKTFESLNIAGRWQRVLSEDFEITRAVREAKRRIHFVPQAIVPNDDATTFRGFFTFARRQSIIVRVCLPEAWWIAALFSMVYVVAFWGSLAVTVVALSSSDEFRATRFGLLAGILLALTFIKAILRHIVVRRVLPCEYVGLRDLLADALFAPLSAILNVALIFASGFSNRFWWRDILYHLRRIDDVRILNRRGGSTTSS